MITSPALGRSRRPAICSRVNLPEPDGPVSATISPGSSENETPFRTSSEVPPCSKVRRTSRSTRTSLIPQRLDRIEPRRPP